MHIYLYIHILLFHFTDRANRMLNRMIIFFGAPVFGGLAIFVGAFFYSKKYDVVVPPSIIAYATQAPFVLGLVGITYSILSSSWDPEVLTYFFANSCYSTTSTHFVTLYNYLINLLFSSCSIWI